MIATTRSNRSRRRSPDATLYLRQPHFPKPFTPSAMTAATRSGVIGKRNKRAPVASNTAFARAAPVVVMGGSPPPCGRGSR